MILGILSDTHGNVARTEAALRVFEQLGVEGLVHCGDIGSLEVLEVLRSSPLHGIPGWVVCGNTDFADPVLVKYGELQGLTMAPVGPVRFVAGGRRFAVFHGHEPEFARLLNHIGRTDALPADFQPCDYVLHGHTHIAADRFVGPLRVLNPGALQRTVTPTVATLDIQADEVHFWQVLETPTGQIPEYIPGGW